MKKSTKSAKNTKTTAAAAPVTKLNVYQMITERITALLENGEVPWKKSWNSRQRAPRNLISGKVYQGINIFLLASAHYSNPYFLTYKQASERGGQVKKGERGLPVIFWNFSEKEDKETGEINKIPFLKYFTVFNVSQIDGLTDLPEVPAENMDEAENFEAAQAIVNSMPAAPVIKHGFSRACYSPAADQVNLPDPKSFSGLSEYFSTCYHELGHSTGHDSRLGRLNNNKNVSFGDANYSKEELVAEFTSAFLSAEAGITQGVIENQAAYIGGWLKKLKEDPKLLIQAAAQAQKAADHILGRGQVEALAEAA
jgi:antirestriction protein ArdC